MEGKPNQLYTQGMRSFEQYDEICKYFAEGKQRDNDANEIQKHLQLYDLSLGEYLVNKYALWLDFRMIDENELHGTGRHIENASEGITLQIEKKEESAGALNAYIYLIMYAQLNKGHFKSPKCKVLDQPDVKDTLHKLHANYVLVPADKAANNVIVVCKKYYIDTLVKELGINNINSNNPTYIQ